MNQLPSMTGAFVIGAVTCAVVGWGVIEGAIWIGTHISIGWA